jgi:hypothetical protein
MVLQSAFVLVKNIFFVILLSFCKGDLSLKNPRFPNTFHSTCISYLL